jgi:hypothetical protein
MKVKKEPKIRISATRRPTAFIFEVKNEKWSQLDQGEVSNFIASFKNWADKIFHCTMKSRQTAERRIFFPYKSV